MPVGFWLPIGVACQFVFIKQHFVLTGLDTVIGVEMEHVIPLPYLEAFGVMGFVQQVIDLIAAHARIFICQRGFNEFDVINIWVSAFGQSIFRELGEYGVIRISLSIRPAKRSTARKYHTSNQGSNKGLIHSDRPLKSLSFSMGASPWNAPDRNELPITTGSRHRVSHRSCLVRRRFRLLSPPSDRYLKWWTSQRPYPILHSRLLQRLPSCSCQAYKLGADLPLPWRRQYLH